jgi:tetratricopeptide (TPR) repeat protein
LDGAIAEYHEALRLNLKNGWAHINLGGALGKKGDSDGQIAEYREAVRVDPNNSMAHYYLGIALMVKKDWDGAVAQYREAVRLDPNNADAHHLLGNMLGIKNDWEGVITEETEALRLNPDSAGAHFCLGDAFEHKHNLKGALDEYRAAYELDPQNEGYRKKYQSAQSNSQGSEQVPDAPGLYVMTAQGLRAIVGRAVVFHRTGSFLTGALTLGVIAGKANIKIPGRQSGMYLPTKPLFYYRASRDDAPGVVSLILSRLIVAHGDRQLEARASGLGRASEGISINSQIQTKIEVAEPGVYRVEPASDLKQGEYAFYLRTRGASTQDAFLYDFSVE